MAAGRYSAARIRPSACRCSSSTTGGTCPSRERSSGTSPRTPTSFPTTGSTARGCSSGCSSSSTTTSRTSRSSGIGRCSATSTTTPTPTSGASAATRRSLRWRSISLATRGSSATRYSIADIALYAYTHVADEGGFDLSGYPGAQRVALARRRRAGPHHDRRLTVSVAQLRRFLVAHQGYATRATDVESRGRGGRDPAAVGRPARLHLDGRSRSQAHAHLATRLVQARHRLAAARRGPDLRVLGARGMSACPSRTTRSSSGAWCI